MLTILDVLLGVATVMLLFSMIVTVVTQFIISAIQSRGRNLKDGLAGLLKQLDPTLGGKIADEIATALLKHPLTKGRFGALGTVIHREEFTILLMELACGQSVNQLNTAAKNALNQLLKSNGIADPASTLKNIRDLALQLENSNPELANNVRNGMAVLQEARSEFVAKIHGGFDQTIDRVSQRFTVSAHAITFVVAMLLAFAMQLDTIALVNRLSSDDTFRAAVASRAQGLLAQNSDKEAAQKEIRKMIEENGLVVAPEQFLRTTNLTGSQLLGIAISALLLSLGAPFWYKALQNLLRVRSALAQKDDQQRKTRQTTQTEGASDSAGPAPAGPTSIQGEQGNLQAVG